MSALVLKCVNSKDIVFLLAWPTERTTGSLKASHEGLCAGTLKGNIPIH